MTSPLGPKNTAQSVPEAIAGFHPPVQSWFTSSFHAPTRAQELAWPNIQSGRSTLILAPTGSGKTLAAFLAAIDRIMFEPVPDPKHRCRVLYISPLKALAVDVERNLRAPLVGVSRYAERMGHPFHSPEVAIRTGDTPSRERAQFNRHPADVLITTPESLYLMLTSSAREALRSVQWVILDEIHAMVGTKRGAHLALSLERLEELVERPLQRIGLSATVRPVDEAARFLGGFMPDAETGQLLPRPVVIADAGRAKQLDLRVEVAVEDMARLGQVIEIPSGNASQGEVRSSIWPAIHPLILDQIRAHRSTLIFVNSRRLAERLAAALNELAGEEIVRAHHGSIAREQRVAIEDDLKAGRLPALVATSSLELGIDMGAIDLVIQVEAPPSVASGIQRIGRAGHQLGAASEGVIIPKFRGDLLACAALTERMQQGLVESVRYPRNALDVLAQQLVGMISLDEWRVDDLEQVVRRAAPYSEMPRSMLEGVLDMLSGRYPSDEFAELRPRVTWDRLARVVRSREGAKRVAITNSGTIPDRGLYGVFLTAGAEDSRRSLRVGELDEEMVFESHPGDVFILGASTWKIDSITHDRVLVSPAPGEVGRMPFWKGDGPGRPLEFGRAIGALTRRVREMLAPAPAPTGSRKKRTETPIPATIPEDAVKLLVEQHALTPGAARNLVQYLQDQQEAAGALPDDRTIVVERYMDEMGDWRVCILSPFGSRVHAPWAMAIEAMVRERSDVEIDLMWTDDGIVVRFPEAEEPPPVEWVIPDPDEVEDLVVRQLGMTALFAGRFRESAARALLLPRKHPGRRAPLWQQRKRAADLLNVAGEYGSFPIILETYRECLQDVFDMPALVGLLREVQQRTVRTVAVTTRVPSPFASTLLFNYVANFIYEGDAPLAERRAQALMVDQSQLRELLGEIELRELLDPDALETLELELQLLAEGRRAKHADGLHDLLLRLGDLTREEVQARCAADPPTVDGWLQELERVRRIIRLPMAGEERYVAAEDAGRYRDALGIPPPIGLPHAFLEFARDPVGDLVARYARTHGPFQTEDLARRLGLGIGPAQMALAALETAGKVLQGEFRPGGSGREWCETGVLRTLRQRSLARLRQEVEPVDAPALARLYTAWHGIRSRRRGPEALLEVVEQLQGAALPASDLESRILPARLAEYDPRELDELTASGAVLWVGQEPLGEHDGRISLYLTEHAALLLPERKEVPDDPVHRKIRDHLSARGATFFAQILQACGGMQQEVIAALWDLVWAGVVTNDTLQPLRAFASPRRRAARRLSGYRGRGLGTRALFPAETSGRWSLVDSFLYTQPSRTERLAAYTRQLLDRHGVLTREAAHHEGISGGFTAIYPVLKAMEESGSIRRGYFVSGCGATQFALPGAVERLRALRQPGSEREDRTVPLTILLGATDPANPYGAALPWPRPGAREAGGPPGERQAGSEAGTTEPQPTLSKGRGKGTDRDAPVSRRPARAAGATVVLVDGSLAAWMGRGERNLVTFLDQVPEWEPEDVALEIARCMAEEVAQGRRRAIFIREVDGRPAQATPMAAALVAEGFTFGPHGYMKRL